MRTRALVGMVLSSLLLAAPALAKGRKKVDPPNAMAQSAASADGSAAPADASGAAPADGAKDAKASTEKGAEVKAAKSIKDRDPVDEGTQFAVGDTVYVWSKITGAAGATVKHVWKKDGKEIWNVSFTVGSVRWRTNSRKRNLKAGSYEVDVVTDDGTQLGSVTFTVQ